MTDLMDARLVRLSQTSSTPMVHFLVPAPQATHILPLESLHNSSTHTVIYGELRSQSQTEGCNWVVLERKGKKVGVGMDIKMVDKVERQKECGMVEGILSLKVDEITYAVGPGNSTLTVPRSRAKLGMREALHLLLIYLHVAPPVQVTVAQLRMQLKKEEEYYQKFQDEIESFYR